MEKITKLSEFINEKYNGSAVKLAREVNAWHGSEVFKIYKKGWCVLNIWANGAKKPRQCRWAWLLLCKYIRVKYDIRVTETWLEPYEIEDLEQHQEPMPTLFSEFGQEQETIIEEPLDADLLKEYYIIRRKLIELERKLWN